MICPSSKPMPKKTVYGTRGDYNGNASEHPLYFRWMNMLRRCYEPTFHGYSSYGGRGVSVEPYLQVFSQYVDFVSKLPHYDDLISNPNEWQIDKDGMGGNEYSRSTIRIVPSTENLEIENAEKRIPVFKIDSNGIKGYFPSITEAEKETGVWRGNIARAVKKGYMAGGFRWGACNL